MKFKITAIFFLPFIFSCQSVLMSLSGEKAATFEVEGEVVHVNGILGKKAHKSFVKMLEENPNVKTLILENVPGSISDEWNVQTCILLHEKGLNTQLLKNSIIASGGVDLYISGNKRYAEHGAQIGVHAWRGVTKEATDYPRDHEEHKIFLDYFEKINRDPDFYWYTLEAAAADDIHWMSEEEIDKYDLVTKWKK